MGIAVECQCYKVATASQAEIDMKFNTLTRMAEASRSDGTGGLFFSGGGGYFPLGIEFFIETLTAPP